MKAAANVIAGIGKWIHQGRCVGETMAGTPSNGASLAFTLPLFLVGDFIRFLARFLPLEENTGIRFAAHNEAEVISVRLSPRGERISKERSS